MYPFFTLSQKVHKSLENPPGRPIVSALKGPLERVGKYLDNLLKVMVTDLKSYVRETGDVLGHIAEIDLQGKPLYTSIPHEWGIRSIEIFLPEMWISK